MLNILHSKSEGLISNPIFAHFQLYQWNMICLIREIRQQVFKIEKSQIHLERS